MKRSIPIIPTLVVLVACAIMVRLGFWQIDRLHQKEAMIARFEAAQAQTEFSYLNPDQPAALYRHVMIYCDRVGQGSVRSGRNAQGMAGWSHVFRCTWGGLWPGTPPDQTMTDYVLRPADVVIGWSGTPAQVKWAGGEVTGTVVPGGELGYHIVADPPLAGLQSNARPDPRDLPNNHLSYAVQWFAFAGIALVIYALALRKRWQGK